MGLLDEAIREHLDLKRRRGADPSEVDRLEREALGPVRRGPDDAADGVIDEQGPLAPAYPDDEEMPSPLEAAPGWSDAPEEPAPFDHGLEPSPDAQWETEPPTQIAPPPADDLPPEPEPTYDPPRHHEIAEEWEAHERQAMLGEPAGLDPGSHDPVPAEPPPPARQHGDVPPPGETFDQGIPDERERPSVSEGYDLEQETMEHDVEAEELGRHDAGKAPEDEDVLEETPEFLQDTPDHDRLWFEQRPPRDFDFDN